MDLPRWWIGILVLSYLANFSYAENVIVPGATWTDTSGNVIQAHGGGFLKVGSTFFWFGEDKSSNDLFFHAVSCYSSTDLINWSRQNNALTPISGTMISSSNIVERPKVLFNKKNSEFVMWFHSDVSGYKSAMVGVATAKSPCGPYTYKGSWKPLGKDSRDMGLFQDDDAAQTSYLLYASDNNQNFKIARLDADYHNVTTVVATLSGSTLEAPGIIKRNNVYFLFASHTTGFEPNPNKWFQSEFVSGTWSAQSDLATPALNTFFSQNAFDMPLGSNGIYMGDRWRSTLLGSSRYMWLPIDFSSGKPKLVQADVWSVNINAGTFTVAKGTTFEAESGTLAGGAKLLTDSGFSAGKGVGFLGKGGTVTINNVQGNGAGQWVALYYANGDSTWRSTAVSVNGGSTVTVDQPNTGSGHVILSVPVKLNLRSGANSITIASNQNTFAGDLDKIIVYTQG